MLNNILSYTQVVSAFVLQENFDIYLGPFFAFCLFLLQKDFDIFHELISAVLNYKNENIEGKYLNNMQKNQFLKVKNSLLELEKDFIELKDRELKDREVKIQREIEKLFFKQIMVSIDDIDKFEQNEMKKKRPIKNTWYDWLFNYIREPIRKSVVAFKDKIICLFKTSTPKQTKYVRGNTLGKAKIQNIRNPFISEKKKKEEEKEEEKEERKNLEKKKNIMKD